VVGNILHPLRQIETVRVQALESSVQAKDVAILLARICYEPIEEFAAAHIRDSLSIPLRPQFASWLGWLVEDDREVIFVIGSDQDHHDLLIQCRKIGRSSKCSELAGGINSWPDDEIAIHAIQLLTPSEIEPSRVLDVRQDSEFFDGHIPGSAHRELGLLSEATDQIPAGSITLMCGHGERAMSAASILERSGRSGLSVLIGGPAQWESHSGQSLIVGADP